MNKDHKIKNIQHANGTEVLIIKAQWNLLFPFEYRNMYVSLTFSPSYMIILG